jgi:hypothetical protein
VPGQCQSSVASQQFPDLAHDFGDALFFFQDVGGELFGRSESVNEP